MIIINNNLQFDGIEFKNGKMYFYNLKKIIFNIYIKKYIFDFIISWKGGEINLGDMWLFYNEYKKKNNQIPQNLEYSDIEQLGKFLSFSRKGLKIENDKFGPWK